MAAASENNFERWQATTIGQLTYAIDLILGLSVAAVAFLVNALLDKDRLLTGVSWLALTCLVGFGVCACLGLALVVNRLRDFRMTMAVARGKVDDTKIAALRDRTSRLGAITWKLFWLQLSVFAISVAALTATGVSLIFVPTPQTTYIGVAIGMNMAQVDYSIGHPDSVSNPLGQAMPGTGFARLFSKDIDEVAIHSHLVWEFGTFQIDRPEINIEFDASKHVRKVGCYDFASKGRCPPLMGITDGATTDEVSTKLGTPTTRLKRDEYELVTYKELGVFISIFRGKVVSLGIDKDAQ